MFFLPKLPVLQNTVKIQDRFSGLDLSPAAGDNTLTDCNGILPEGDALTVCNPRELLRYVYDPYYTLMSPGHGEWLEVYFQDAKVVRHHAATDGTPITHTISLPTETRVEAATRYCNDLILLARNGKKLLLYRYDPNSSLEETVDISDVLDPTAKGTLNLFAFGTRLALIQNNNLQIGGFRTISNWTEYLPEDFSDLPNAPHQFSFYSGHLTAGIDFRSHPVLFDQTRMYLIYNNVKPFNIVKTADVGCINPRSIAVCNGVLCFLSTDGVMAYNGTGLPYKISQAIPDISTTAANAAGAALGDCYYLGEYVYSFSTKRWSKFFSAPVKTVVSSMCLAGQQLRFTASGNFLTVEYLYDPVLQHDDASPSQWDFTTREFHEQEPGKKVLNQIAFQIQPKEQTRLEVQLSADGAYWTSIFQGDFTKSDGCEVRVKTPPLQNFSLRFLGEGRASIPYLRRVYHLLSDGKIHPFI